ncbi:Hypothetical protein EIN_049860, partial [Entamoeba invadens IP1]
MVEMVTHPGRVVPPKPPVFGQGLNKVEPNASVKRVYHCKKCGQSGHNSRNSLIREFVSCIYM